MPDTVNISRALYTIYRSGKERRTRRFGKTVIEGPEWDRFVEDVKSLKFQQTLDFFGKGDTPKEADRLTNSWKHKIKRLIKDQKLSVELSEFTLTAEDRAEFGDAGPKGTRGFSVTGV